MNREREKEREVQSGVDGRKGQSRSLLLPCMADARYLWRAPIWTSHARGGEGSDKKEKGVFLLIDSGPSLPYVGEVILEKVKGR